MASSAGEWVRAFAPATVSNLTCGFDLLGFAIERWGDVVAARASGVPGVRILGVTGDGGRLPVEPERNTAGIAALELLAGGALPVRELIEADDVPLAGLLDAIERLGVGELDAKVMIAPGRVAGRPWAAPKPR